jgi:hypothetical protein
MANLGPGFGVFPWEVSLNNRGFVCGKHPDTGLPMFQVLGQKQIQERLDTGDLTGVYGSPEAEVPEVYSDLSRGYGLSVQHTAHPNMYAYASDVDARIPGRTMLGFKQTAITLTGAPAHVRAIAVMSDGGTQTIYAAAGDQVFSSTNGTSFSLANDFANDETITDLTVFRGTQSKPTLYVGFDDNKTSPPKFATYINGTGWTTEGSNTASFFVVDNNALWRIWHDSGVPKADKATGGGTGATFGADITLGDATYGATAAIFYQDRPYIFQQDTMLQLNDDGDDFKSEVWPGMQNVTDQWNGVGATVFLNRLYMPVAGGVYEYILSGTDQQLLPMGPDLVVSNNSLVRGRITAMVGDRDHYLYGVLQNESGNSFLIAWDPAVRAWHGSLADLGAITCRSMVISDKATTNPTLFIAADSDLISVVLERNGRDRSNDSNCTFSQTGSLFYPAFHGHLPFILKQSLAVNIRAVQLAANGSALVKYRTVPSGSYTEIGSSFAAVGQDRIKFPTSGNGVKSQILEVQIALTGTATGTVTPIYGDFTLFYAVIPDLKRLFEMWLRVGDSLPLLDGSFDPATYEVLEQHIIDAVASGIIAFTSLNGSSYNVLVRGEPRETQAQYEVGQPYETLYYVLAAEYERLNVLGTTGRMEGFTTGELEAYTTGQIEVI